MNFKQFPDIQRFPHIALDTETDGIAYPTSRHARR
jgi:hypothetical protein